MTKKIKKFIEKRKTLFDFASFFLDGFLPSDHPILLNPKKRQRLRIYIGLSFFISLLIFLLFGILINLQINLHLVLFYCVTVLAFLIVNYITRFKNFEFFLFIVIFLGIGINVYIAIYSNVFPPINYASFLLTIIVLHYVYNRWISLFYNIVIILVLLTLVLTTNILKIDIEIIQLRLRYFYDYVFTSLIMWFVLEVYEHFREELELKLVHINESREKDLELAREIQKQFYPILPKNDYYYFDYLTLPYDKVSGDYLDVIQKENCFYLALGDVTGHGLQSAMLTMQINTLLNYLIIEKDQEDISAIFMELNNHYYKIINKLNIKNYASLILIKIDLNGKVIITGSLNHIFYYDSEKSKIEFINYVSPLLGLKYISSREELKIIELQLKPSDSLFFCTDGLIEIFLKNQNLLDRSEFIRILNNFFNERKQSQKEIKLNEFPSFLRQYISSFSFQDDVSAILIQYKKPVNH